MKFCKCLLILICLCCLTACGAKDPIIVEDVEDISVVPVTEEPVVPLSISLTDVGTVTIFDKTYTIPFECKELIDDGMEFNTLGQSLDAQVEPGKSDWLDVILYEEANLYSVSIGVINNTNTVKAAKDCTVYSVSQREDELDDVLRDTPTNASVIRVGDNISIIEDTFGKAIPKSDNLYHDFKYIFGLDIPYLLSVSYIPGSTNFSTVAITCASVGPENMRDSYAMDCINYEDLYYAKNNWHLQESAELSVTSVSLDKDWWDHYYFNGTTIHFGSAIKTHPYTGDGEVEIDVLVPVESSEYFKKTLELADDFTGAINSAGGGVDSTVEKYIDNASKAGLEYAVRTQRTTTDYDGDAIMDGMFLFCPYGYQLSDDANTNIISLGDTYKEAVSILGSEPVSITESVYRQICTWNGPNDAKLELIFSPDYAADIYADIPEDINSYLLSEVHLSPNIK